MILPSDNGTSEKYKKIFTALIVGEIEKKWITAAYCTLFMENKLKLFYKYQIVAYIYIDVQKDWT